jgi:filamentous hemagglutinin
MCPSCHIIVKYGHTPHDWEFSVKEYVENYEEAYKQVAIVLLTSAAGGGLAAAAPRAAAVIAGYETAVSAGEATSGTSAGALNPGRLLSGDFDIGRQLSTEERVWAGATAVIGMLTIDAGFSGSGAGGGPSRSGNYIPRDPHTGNVIPLSQQRIKGTDIPLPDPRASGPHTVLGGRTSSRTGETYRQSATFEVPTWPLAGGQSVPWGRIDWSHHGRPSVHTNPHIHLFTYDFKNKRWVQGSAEPVR